MSAVSKIDVRAVLKVVGLAAILSTLSTACHENLNGPPASVSVPSLPAAGASAVATIGADGVASATLGESRIDFTVLSTAGSAMAGASAAVLLGDEWLLIAVSDIQNRVAPAVTAVSTSIFNAPAPAAAFEGSGVAARRKAITVAHTAPGVVSVIASLETSDVAVRESDLSDESIDLMEADAGLNLTCDAEFDIDVGLQSPSGSGHLIVFGTSRTDLAFNAAANPDDVFAKLASETEAVSTDILIGCEVVVGESNNDGLRVFIERTVQYGGIYAHTGQIFAGDPLSTLYLVEVDPNGVDIALGPIIKEDGRALNIVDIARPPGDILTTGPALLGIADRVLYTISRVDGGARVHIEYLSSNGVNGLAFDGSVVYGSTATGKLMQLIPTPPNVDSMLHVGQFNAQGLVSAGDIAFSPTTGELYGVLAESPDRFANQNFLARIDRNTGQATIIGDISPPGFTGWYDEVWGLAFFRGELYGLTSLPGQLIKIDTQTAAAEKIRDLSFNATGAGDRKPN